MAFKLFVFLAVLKLVSSAADPVPDPDVIIQVKQVVNGDGCCPEPEPEPTHGFDMRCDPPNFTIVAGTQYGCPCSYYSAVQKNAWIGGQCCKPSDCPNTVFTNLHVCGSEGAVENHSGWACRDSTDALEFAKQAWTDPQTITFQYVFACTGISYNFINDICVMERPQVEFPLAWYCTIDSGVVTSCKDIGNCWVNSNAIDGSVIEGSFACYNN